MEDEHVAKEADKVEQHKHIQPIPKYKWYQRGLKQLLLAGNPFCELQPERDAPRLLKWSFDFSHQHPFIFVEVLENDDNNEAVCFGCKKPAIISLVYVA